MKTKTIIVMLMLATTLVARAGLVDLGEVNWTTAHSLPPGLLAIFHALDHHQVKFLDSIETVPWTEPNGTPHPPGWVSLYGALAGGALFTTDVLELAPTDSASVAWDFGDTGYRMGFIDVFGLNASGDSFEHFYRTNGPAFKLDGSGMVTLDGTIQQIAFYGKTPELSIDDTGSTLLCLGIGIAALFLRFPHNQLRNSNENTVKGVGQADASRARPWSDCRAVGAFLTRLGCLARIRTA